MSAIRRCMFTLAVTLLGAAHVAGAAPVYPSKPIRVIVPFPAGGGTDIIAREVTNKVAMSTGWTFVVDNKPGSGGNLGGTPQPRPPPMATPSCWGRPATWPSTPRCSAICPMTRSRT